MGHSERDCAVVTEDDKKKGLGWGIYLRASPCKGRGKEIEEMEAVVAGRKALFVIKKEEAPKECPRSSVVMTPVLVVEGARQGALRQDIMGVNETVVEVEEEGGRGNDSLNSKVDAGGGMREGKTLGSSLTAELVRSESVTFAVGTDEGRRFSSAKGWKRRSREARSGALSELHGATMDVELGKRGRNNDCEMTEVEGASKKVVVNTDLTGLRLAEAADVQPRLAQ